MKFAKSLALFFLAIAFTASALPAKAETNSATEVVKTFYAQLVDTMKQGDSLGFAGRYKKLEPAVESAFNLPLMARFAAGPAWNTASPDEQQRLVAAFSDFSVANYASRFTKYDGERFDVLDEKPAAGGGTIVETKLTPKNSEPVTLNYLLRPDENGQLRIVDVFLDATISELATRRAEFSSIIKRDGFSALVATLNGKAKKMGAS